MTWSINCATLLLLLSLTSLRAPPFALAQIYPVSKSDETFVRDCVGRETEKLFVLTFDDGPAKHTGPILDILKEKDAPATFFVVGSVFDAFPANRQANEDLVRRTIQEGHIVANHGMTNFEFSLQEVQQCEEMVRRVTDGYSMTYFRPAQGLYTAYKHEALIDIGYKMIMWNLDVADWKWGRNPDDVLTLIHSAVWNPTIPVPTYDSANAGLPRRGSYVMLAHDYKDLMLKPVAWGQPLLSAIIDAVRDAGYEIVSLDECLAGPPGEQGRAALRGGPTHSPTHAPSIFPFGVTIGKQVENPVKTTTIVPTTAPVGDLTSGPTDAPTGQPSHANTAVPTDIPTAIFTNTAVPTDIPKVIPTNTPMVTLTGAPTDGPIIAPTGEPIAIPTFGPTIAPTGEPTSMPIIGRTIVPTGKPTSTPTDVKMSVPSLSPTDAPQPDPSSTPRRPPTVSPTVGPTAGKPTSTPTDATTSVPSLNPTDAPQPDPSSTPRRPPTVSPTVGPTAGKPTSSPTDTPQPDPSSTPRRPPTVIPTVGPTAAPPGVLVSNGTSTGDNVFRFQGEESTSKLGDSNYDLASPASEPKGVRIGLTLSAGNRALSSPSMCWTISLLLVLCLCSQHRSI